MDDTNGVDNDGGRIKQNIRACWDCARSHRLGQRWSNPVPAASMAFLPEFLTGLGCSN